MTGIFELIILAAILLAVLLPIGIVVAVSGFGFW